MNHSCLCSTTDFCRLILGLVFLGIFLPLTTAQSASLPLRSNTFPLMGKLQRGDALFDQISASISAYYKARVQKTILPDLNLVRYQVQANETLYIIAARLNLPHSTIASINHISSPSQVHSGQELIIPNLPGIYLPIQTKSQLEQLLSNRLAERITLGENIRFQTAAGLEEFRYFPSEDFSPRERLAFLGSLFRSPLTSYRLTSNFGPRLNPLSGQLIHHDGLDMAAPSGTPVLAAGDGVVLETGADPIYGTFMIIEHAGGYETLYAHLSKILTRKGQAVASGDPVAKVGSTGETTGPHLHFEIHYNGSPRDPLKFIKK